MLWGENRGELKGWQLLGVEPRTPLAWATSALSLSYNNRATTSPHSIFTTQVVLNASVNVTIDTLTLNFWNILLHLNHSRRSIHISPDRPKKSTQNMWKWTVSTGKFFALPELQTSQKSCVHVAVDRLSGSLTWAQGAERSKRLSIQVEVHER